MQLGWKDFECVSWYFNQSCIFDTSASLPVSCSLSSTNNGRLLFNNVVHCTEVYCWFSPLCALIRWLEHFKFCRHVCDSRSVHLSAKHLVSCFCCVLRIFEWPFFWKKKKNKSIRLAPEKTQGNGSSDILLLPIITSE